MASVPSRKGLSAGTMNLKFMMRAVEDITTVPALENKKVADEGEWDIGPERRQALGIPTSAPEAPPSSSSNRTAALTKPASAVTHESSYIPFMMQGAGANGRFTYKDGVLYEESMALDRSLEEPAGAVPEPMDSKSASTSKPVKSISHQRHQPHSQRLEQQQLQPSGSLSAPSRSSHLISNSISRGRAEPRPPTKTNTPAMVGTFLRPAGVDDVPAISAGSSSSTRVASSKKRPSPSTSKINVPGDASSTEIRKKKKKRKDVHVEE